MVSLIVMSDSVEPTQLQSLATAGATCDHEYATEGLAKHRHFCRASAWGACEPCVEFTRPFSFLLEAAAGPRTMQSTEIQQSSPLKRWPSSPMFVAVAGFDDRICFSLGYADFGRDQSRNPSTSEKSWHPLDVIICSLG